MFERIEHTEAGFVAVWKEGDDEEDRRLLTPDEAKEYAKIMKGNKRNRMKAEAEKAVYYYKMDRSEQFSDR